MHARLKPDNLRRLSERIHFRCWEKEVLVGDYSQVIQDYRPIRSRCNFSRGNWRAEDSANESSFTGSG